MEELEHPEGTPKLEIKEREHEFKKIVLAKRWGISPEKLEERLSVAKEFFELRKKALIKDWKRQDTLLSNA